MQEFTTMIHSVRRRARAALILALMGLAVVGVLAQQAPVNAKAVVAAPSLVDATTTTTQMSEIFTVTGAGFTSGGPVYLAIYDQMGTKLYETRWITATSTRPRGGGYQSVDAPSNVPAIVGGTLFERFGQLCGTNAMIRALDETTETWSNWLQVQFSCAGDGGGGKR